MTRLNLDTARQLLQVGADATPQEVRHAYRRASLQTHPDKVGGESAPFHRLTEAFELVSQAAERQARQPADRPSPPPPAGTHATPAAPAPQSRNRPRVVPSMHSPAAPAPASTTTPFQAPDRPPFSPPGPRPEAAVPTQAHNRAPPPSTQQASPFAHLTTESRFDADTIATLTKALDTHFNRGTSPSPWSPDSKLRALFTSEWRAAAKERKTLRRELSEMRAALLARRQYPKVPAELKKDALTIMNFLATISSRKASP